MYLFTLSYHALNEHHSGIFLKHKFVFYFCYQGPIENAFCHFPLPSHTQFYNVAGTYLKHSLEIQCNMSTEKILNVVPQGCKLPQGEYFLQRVSKDILFASKRRSVSSRFLKTSMSIALGSRLSKSKLCKWLNPKAQTIGSGLLPCQIALLLLACGLILPSYRHSPQREKDVYCQV